MRALREYGFAGTLAALVVLCAGVARGDGVGDVLVSVSLPPATVAVIDPESGTSSGGGTTDVRLGVGDVILFRLNYFPLPDQQIRGLNGYLTEYVPANTEVVGIRLIDPNGLTVLPRYPGIANDGCARACNGFNAVPCNPALTLTPACTAGGTRNLDDGTISELHADTGIFYSSAARIGRNPTNAFLAYTNGILMSPSGTYTGSIAPILNISAPFYSHDDWDYWQVRGLGASGNPSGNNGTGNTPFGYGSPVAGPNTGYPYEVTLRGAAYEFNDVVGPWSRMRTPGSLIGTGSAATGTGTLRRMIADASALGADITPLSPMPAGTRAVRAALGEMRPGEYGAMEVALRVTGTPIDPAFMRDADCGEIFGTDTSGRSDTGRARDNPWGLFIPSPACTFLNLLFDLTVDDTLAVTGGTLNYSLHGRNLSINPQTGVTVTQKYDSTRVSFVSATGTYSLVSNCDGDGLDCIRWTLGTLAPSDDYILNSVFTVGGGGQVTNVMRAVYRSNELPGGFTTQAVNLVRAVPVLRASAVPNAASTAAGGNAAYTATIRNDGSGDMGVDSLTLVLPGATWRATGSAAATITISGAGGGTFACSSGCTTSTPTFSGLGINLTAGSVRTVTGSITVPAGTATALYDVDLQVWGSTMAFGGAFETYFPDVLRLPVGAPRSAAPVLDCPILASTSTIVGSTSEADGTDVRAYFSLVQRGVDTNATGGRFSVTGFTGTFGPLYAGLEVRATAQAPGELESELSAPCTVIYLAGCQDGLDNDSDGLADFPADPGCSGPTDTDETDVQCNNTLDDDSDGATDWPRDLECTGPDDTTEAGTPACGNGVDDDGDGAVDYPADTGCTSAADRTEVTRRACMDGIDNDGDGQIDFGLDPGCHSANDSSEVNFTYAPGDIRPRILLVFDTSGSMNGNVCGGAFTGGDGSTACGGGDVSCAVCNATGCGNGIADDSRMHRARVGVSDVVAGYGDVEFSLMRYHQRATDFACPGTNASLRSGGWQGGGASPCGGGFAAGDLLVGFAPENSLDLLEWMDGSSNYTGTAPAGMDIELRGSGTTPIAGALTSARTALLAARSADTVAGSCRPYRVILLTDGLETCGGDPVAAASALSTAGFPTHVIGFAVASPSLNDIANAGGTGTAIFADDSTELSSAIASIVESSIRFETCNMADDDCDTRVDEGFPLFCNRPAGIATQNQCVDPGETVCNGVDDNCDGRIDEGVTNACGTCGAVPAEVCNLLDDDCDGIIDDGVCGGCVPSPELCDNIDNDCDGMIDEMLSRVCGTDVGACVAGTQTCSAGGWGVCTGSVGPVAETCNNLDDNCDGVVDGISQACGSDVGACQAGIRTCVAGTFGACTGAVGPTTEVCNGADDDCDGVNDDGNPGGGAACGTATGECSTGTLSCSGGALVCTGAVGPTPETCDNQDDDCDGVVDNGVASMGPCGIGTGECEPGALQCVSGAFACVGARGPATEICNGLDDDCDGTNDDGNPGGGAACGSSIGECATGTLACTAGALTCTGGVTPATETCDGQDDDCDGNTDEGIATMGPCGTATGECEPGVMACSGGAFTCTNARGPVTEVCNGLDDDCDGTNDDGNPGGGASCGTAVGECSTGALSCVAGTLTCTGGISPTTETCDGQDDDCDGATDESVATMGACGPSTGECAPGVMTCSGGSFMCVGATGPVAEACNGRDDDCDASIDEGNPGGGASCGSSLGECAPGALACTGGTLVCTGAVLPAAEACDGDDDDCDGVTDEGIATMGACGPATGACEPGVLTCSGGSFMCVGAMGPVAEACNGRDDDCDGTTDEGNPDGGAACGTSLGECTQGALTCVGGSLTCAGGVGPIAETCNALDDDCDGTSDEAIPSTGACGSDVGECDLGALACVGGTFTCVGARGALPELCNSRDDDCDAMTDEGNPGGGVSCGTDIGECSPGTSVCTSGVLGCTGGVTPATEACNALDDDCDGLTDEGSPGAGASCGTTDEGECDFGALACVAGALTCVGESGPTAELCDGRDNDCDAMIDEGNPEGGVACGNETGECTAGVTLCTAGALTCDGGTGPTPEICNLLDDDCDGVEDEGIPVGAPCGSDVGECSPGVSICRAGGLVCEGEIGPIDETCNALDDDCDGSTDEGLPVGVACGTDEGVCMVGTIQCIAGAEICVGETTGGPETCDCEDNDCDMMTDETPPGGSLCPAGSACVECQCALPCVDGEFGFECPSGRFPSVDGTGTCHCIEELCVPADCLTQTIDDGAGTTLCAPDSTDVGFCVCRNNACTHPCEGVVCASPLVCDPRDGSCEEPGCRGLGCPEGEICNRDTTICEPDPCVGVTCDAGEACRAGVCEGSCATVMCGATERCEAGTCVADLCSGVTCDTGEVCDPADGSCVADACLGVTCRADEVCDPVTGDCNPDPCEMLTCPTGQVCVAGECTGGMVGVDAGPMSGMDAGLGVDAGVVPPVEDEHFRALGAGGACFCTASSRSEGRGSLLLLALLGVVLARRRRGGGARRSGGAR